MAARELAVGGREEKGATCLVGYLLRALGIISDL